MNISSRRLKCSMLKKSDFDHNVNIHFGWKRKSSSHSVSLCSLRSINLMAMSICPHGLMTWALVLQSRDHGFESRWCRTTIFLGGSLIILLLLHIVCYVDKTT